MVYFLFENVVMYLLKAFSVISNLQVNFLKKVTIYEFIFELTII